MEAGDGGFAGLFGTACPRQRGGGGGGGDAGCSLLPVEYSQYTVRKCNFLHSEGTFERNAMQPFAILVISSAVAGVCVWRGGGPSSFVLIV